MIFMLTRREFSWVVVLAVLCLGIGICAGMLTERVVFARDEAGRAPGSHGRGGDWHGGSASSIRDLAEELNLRPEQVRRIDEVSAKNQAAIREMEAEQWKAESRSRDEIVAVLDSEQRANFEAHQRRERDERRRKAIDEEVKRWTLILDLDAEHQKPFGAAIADLVDKKCAYFRSRFEKGEHFDRDETKEFFKSWMEQKAAALRPYLTEAQFQKYQALEWSGH